MQTKQAYPPPAGPTPFSGVYSDLSGKPTLGTSSAKDSATTAEILANTANKMLETDESWAAVAFVDGTSVTGTVNLDFATFVNKKYTFTGNVTFTVSNAKQGQAGSIEIRQDATGSRTMTLTAGSFLTANGTAPALSTTANALDVLDYQVMSNGKVRVSLTKALA